MIDYRDTVYDLRDSRGAYQVKVRSDLHGQSICAVCYKSIHAGMCTTCTVCRYKVHDMCCEGERSVHGWLLFDPKRPTECKDCAADNVL